MNCKKEITDEKVKFVVRLLPKVLDNKLITELLRGHLPDAKIGDDYVRDVRKHWTRLGFTEDWTAVRERMKSSHHSKNLKMPDKHHEQLVYEDTSVESGVLSSGGIESVFSGIKEMWHQAVDSLFDALIKMTTP